VLAAVDLDNHPISQTNEIKNVTVARHLPTEMKST